jgi:hypothetical protein
VPMRDKRPPVGLRRPGDISALMPGFDARTARSRGRRRYCSGPRSEHVRGLDPQPTCQVARTDAGLGQHLSRGLSPR